MRKRKVLRLLLIAGIAAFLALSPPYIRDRLGRDEYRAYDEKPEPAWKGSIEIWHIATFRAFQGSVTDYLQSRADAFCSTRPGIDIDVVGLTLKKYNDRIARGATPDAYSFQTGLCDPEQFRKLELAAPAFSGNLTCAAYGDETLAVPYMAEGYFFAENTLLAAKYTTRLPERADTQFLQSVINVGAKEAQLYMPALFAAREGLNGTLAAQEAFLSGKAAYAVIDARTLGDATRAEEGGLSIKAIPYEAYSDEVFYLGASRTASAEQAAALELFIEFLLTDAEQSRLASIGALPVTRSAKPVYADANMNALFAAGQSLLFPDAFCYRRHQSALLAEAEEALKGDPFAQKSFLSRFGETFLPPRP